MPWGVCAGWMDSGHDGQGHAAEWAGQQQHWPARGAACSGPATAALDQWQQWRDSGSTSAFAMTPAAAPAAVPSAQWCPHAEAQQHAQQQAQHARQARQEQQTGVAAAATARASGPHADTTASTARPPRGQKRRQTECSSEREMTTQELERLEGNALRLRGLLRNASATPDKRRFSLDLESQIVVLEQTVASTKAEQDVQHVDVRARLHGLSL